MPARPFDLRIEQGADYEVVVPVLNEADQPIDLTGWQARGQVRRTVYDDAVLLDLAALLSTGADGITLFVPGATSSAWAWRQGVYDVELVDPDGEVTRLLTGFVFVIPEVTR